MPKAKKESKSVKPYTKVTGHSLTKFSYFKSEDDTNLTATGRRPGQYAHLLNVKSIEQIVKEQAAIKGGKINILDAGCGQAVVINNLLSDTSLTPFIQKISGVSLHYFHNVKVVAESHPERFNFYLGKVQDVLKKSHETFDLILDGWGAYNYSDNKPDLLKLYHDVLNPHGKAFVYVSRTKLDITTKAGTKINFYMWAAEKFPQTFSYYSMPHKSLIITKETQRYPLCCSDILERKEVPSLTLPGLDVVSLKKGNAMAVSEVVVEPESTSLRSLSYKKM